jgi:hypothetical protein
MGYEVISSGEETLIMGPEMQVKVRIGPAILGPAFALGHLYKIKGGFVPVKTYVFEALETGDISLGELKKTMDFFFSVLLDTEWYVKEVPPGSSLFTQEAERWYGKEAMEESDGAISVIRSGRSE